MTTDPTPEQVNAAGQVLKHTTFCHRRTAIRPANADEARAIAVVWARLFAAHNLQLDDLIAGVEKRASEGAADTPEPAEIITFARAVRRDRTEREDAAARRAREDAIDAKIVANTRQAIAPAVQALGNLDRTTTTTGGGRVFHRPADPDRDAARAAARAELDAARVSRSWSGNPG